MTRPRRLVVPLLATVLVTLGCATRMGSRSLPRVRASYNEAISQSIDQQMLLNMVRLRYLHSPTFLQLGSVVTQYSLTTDVGASGSYNAGTGGGPVPRGSVGGAAGVVVSERPTITYVPLQGEQFVQRVATPLTAAQVLLLIQAGWGADLVLTTCVRRVNDVHAPRVSSKTDDDEFHRLAGLLYGLQLDHELRVHRDERGPVMSLRTREGDALSVEAEEALRLMGLSPQVHDYPVVDGEAPPLPGTVALQGRSVLDTMFYLSQGVEVPPQDAAARDLGISTPVIEPRLRVQSSRREPRDAYVAVRYRDRWFYVDESDHRSKRAFALLTFLFNITAMPGAQGPLLTVGASG